MTETPTMHEYKHFAVPNVWLRGGFERADSPYGPVVSYADVEGLEHQLRLTVVHQDRMLTGAQIRFLRMGLELSQPDFAKRLGVNEQTVARWEKGETPVTPMVDQTVRLAVARVWLPDLPIGSLPAPKQAPAAPRIVFSYQGGKWQRTDRVVRISYVKTEAFQVHSGSTVSARRGVQIRGLPHYWTKFRRMSSTQGVIGADRPEQTIVTGTHGKPFEVVGG